MDLSCRSMTLRKGKTLARHSKLMGKVKTQIIYCDIGLRVR
jgi:hypothetical protein